MEFNADVASQAAVLASILAGFALAITAQIVLSDTRTDQLLGVAVHFTRCSVACIFAVLSVLFYLGSNQRNTQFVASIVIIVSIFVALVSFYVAVDLLLSSVSRKNAITFLMDIILPFFMILAFSPVLFVLWALLQHFGWVT